MLILIMEPTILVELDFKCYFEQMSFSFMILYSFNQWFNGIQRDFRTFLSSIRILVYLSSFLNFIGFVTFLTKIR